MQGSIGPVLVATLGIALLTAMDGIAKHLSAEFATLQIVFARFAISGLCALGLVIVLRAGWPQRDRLGAHAVRAVLMVVTSSTFFYAIGRLPLAEVFAITFTGPIFVALFGALLLREPVTPPIWLAILGGFAGMLVIVGTGELGTGRSDELLAWAAAIASPITYALSIVLLRSQAQREPQTVIVLVQSLMVAGLALPFAIPAFRVPEGEALGWFLALGLLGTAGYLCLVSALSRLSAARFGVVDYTGLLWAALIGWALFDETPRLTLWFGAALIVSACLLILKKKA